MSTPYAYSLGRADRILLVLVFCSLAGWEFTKAFWPHRPVDGWPEAPTEVMATIDSSWIYYPAPSSQRNGKQRGTAVHGGLEGHRVDLPKDAMHGPDTNNSPVPHPRIQPVQMADATLEQLQATGFPRHVASNIIKYRAAGGQLRDSTALLRIYGMDQRIWTQVKSHIIFPARSFPSTSAGPASILDLNTATAADLEGLPGIGPGRANAILKFRNMLGGFHDTSQLRECYTLPPETVDAILPHLVIRSAPARLFVNRTRLDTLYHPYANRKILRVLESYKRQHGYLRDPGDLRRAYPPDTTWIGRLLPYLDFSLDETVSAGSDPSMER